MTTIAELEQRLNALEQRQQLPPSFAPSVGMVVTADGKIAYDFDGHVHGAGVDLDAGAEFALIPQPDRRLAWLDHGSPIADIAGLTAPGPPVDRVLSLSAYTNGDYGATPPVAGLDIHARNDGSALLRAFANATEATVLDGNGNSGFVGQVTPSTLKLAGPYNGGPFALVPGVTVLGLSNPPGLIGTLVIELLPSGHFNFTATPQQAGTQLAINNFGVAQNLVRVSYLQVCT